MDFDHLPMFSAEDMHSNDTNEVMSNEVGPNKVSSPSKPNKEYYATLAAPNAHSPEKKTSNRLSRLSKTSANKSVGNSKSLSRLKPTKIEDD